MTTYTVKQEMSLNSIHDRFVAMDRGTQFSLEALEAIMEYLSMDNEIAMDLDVIAICCEFTESAPREIIWDYDWEEADFNYDDVLDYDEVLAEVQEHTWAVLLDNGNIVYVNF